MFVFRMSGEKLSNSFLKIRKFVEANRSNFGSIWMSIYYIQECVAVKTELK